MRSTMYTPRIAVASLLSFVIGVAIAGCAQLGAVTPTENPSVVEVTDPPFSPVPSKSPGPTVSFQGDPSGCLDSFVQVQRVTFDMQTVARIIPIVVLGRFDHYEAARWNTASGKKPTDLEKANAPEIYRPAVIKVDNALRGSVGSEVTAAVSGGEVGCDRMRFSTDPDLKEGDQYAFLIQGAVDTDGKVFGLGVSDAWAVSANGIVETERDGQVPLSAFQDVLDSTPSVVDQPKVP